MHYLIIIGLLLAIIAIISFYFLKVNNLNKGKINLELNDLLLKQKQYELKFIDYNNQIKDYKKQIEELQQTVNQLKLKTDELTKINISLELEIDKLNQKQLKLIELQKQREDFFAIYVHDLKNPTATIQNLIELLNSYDLSFTEQKEIIDALNALSKRLIKLTNEICKIVIESESNLVFEFKKGRLDEIIKKIYIRNIYKARKKNISIFLNIQENLPNVVIDPDKIEDAIENLVDNSIKYSNPNKSVLIEIKTMNDKISVIVADQGLGFSEEDLRNIFIKGSKLSARPTGDESSTGLGLWIVKRIIDEHKGNISIESTVGVGTKITIELPVKIS